MTPPGHFAHAHSTLRPCAGPVDTGADIDIGIDFHVDHDCIGESQLRPVLRPLLGLRINPASPSLSTPHLGSAPSIPLDGIPSCHLAPPRTATTLYTYQHTIHAHPLLSDSRLSTLIFPLLHAYEAPPLLLFTVHTRPTVND